MQRLTREKIKPTAYAVGFYMAKTKRTIKKEVYY